MEPLYPTPPIWSDLEQEKRKNDIIRRFAIELGKISNLKDKLDNILAILDHSFQLKHTMLLLPDVTGTCLQVFASRGFAVAGIGAKVAIGQGVIGVVASRKRRLRISNISWQRKYLQTQSEDSDATPISATALPGLPDVESQVAIPLLANEELIAVLSAESVDVNFFSREDEAFLMTLSQLLALSIQNAMVLEQLEQKVRERTAILEAQKRELEQLNASKDRLFSIIGHDLRSPAASLQNATELIRYYQSKGDMEQLSAVGCRITRAASNINHMLDSLLSWSITQTGDLRVQPEKLVFAAVLAEVLEVYEEMAHSKQIRIEHASPPGLCLWSDRNSTVTILRNVLSNAVKFTEAGGCIRITATPWQDFVQVLIIDDGIGMSPEQQQHLFCLQKGRSSKGTASERGLGLGMLLVREFIERNNGRVAVSSQPGQGTQIRLFFPATEPAAIPRG